MKRKLIFTIGSVIVLTTTVFSQENFLSNYQFDDSSTPVWALNNNNGGDGEFEFDASGALSGENCGLITVNGVGTDDYNIQLVQNAIPVAAGVTYYLSFMAKVDEEFIMHFSWEENGGAWTRYAQNSFTLTPGTTAYSHEFEASGDDETANVKFFFGAPANLNKVVMIDSIVLSDSPDVYDEQVSVKNNMSSEILNVYPNPATENFSVSLNLEEGNNITLDLINLSGQKETTLLNDIQKSGSFAKQFSRQGLANGVYFLRLTTNSQSIVKKLVIN